MRRDDFTIKVARCAGVTAVSACSGRTFSRHSHDEYGIGVILSGAQKSWSGRGPVEAERGDVITVNAGEVHDGTSNGASRSWAMLYISPVCMAEIVSSIYSSGVQDVEFTQPVLRNPTAAHRFGAAYRSYSLGHAASADELLVLAIASVLGETRPRRPETPPGIGRAKNRIDSDPAVAHPLTDLARLTGASSFQTLRGFARETGLTPHAYVIQRRLDMARSMIRNGTTLADAAFASGFADQSHFHRAFTQRYGLTPGAFAAAVR